MKAAYLFQNDFRIQNNELVANALAEAISESSGESIELDFTIVKPKNFDLVDELGFPMWSNAKKKVFFQALLFLSKEIHMLNLNFYFFNDLIEFNNYLKHRNIEFLFVAASPFSYENEYKSIISSNIKIVSQVNNLLIEPDNLNFLFDSFTSFTKFKKAVEKSQWPIKASRSSDLSLNQFKADALNPNIKASEILLESSNLVSTQITSDLKSAIKRVLDWSQENLKDLKNIEVAFDLKGDRESALTHLQTYVWDKKHIKHYKQTRNGMIEFYDSSKFSMWLAWGVLSPVEIFQEILAFEDKYEPNSSTYWLKLELLWRDYFKWMADNCGDLLFMPRGLSEEYTEPEMNSFNKKLFINWCEGRTKNSFINANMIELKTSGFISNRGRQNVASYLVHELNLSWLWGAKWFESQLIDFDPASNYGNWQYISGVGGWGDHKFDYDWQSQTYDPDQKYQKIWL